MDNQDRIHFLDNLRGIVILLVVMFHASLTCMKQSPVWWYTHNANVSSVHSMFVVLADTFMMPILFLISGLIQGKFSQRSLPLKKRAYRLLVPWFTGVLLVGPYLSIKVATNLGHQITWGQMIIHDFWNRYFTQGPYWYLSLLFSFILISIIVPEQVMSKIKGLLKSKWSVFALLLIVSVAGYWIGSHFWGPDTWVDIVYLWYFQPSRLLTYFSFYLVGLLSAKQITELGINGWKSNTVCVILGLLLVIFKGIPGQIPSIVMAIVYGLVTVVWSFRLFGLAANQLNEKSFFLNWLNSNSFSLYLIHLPVQVFIGSLLVQYKLNAWTMWSALVLSSLIVTWGVGKILILRIFEKRIN